MIVLSPDNVTGAFLGAVFTMKLLKKVISSLATGFIKSNTPAFLPPHSPDPLQSANRATSCTANRANSS